MTDDIDDVAITPDLAYCQILVSQQGQSDSVPQEGDTVSEDEAQAVALRAELGRINVLGLGASLVSRDFTLYQRKRVIEAELADIKRRTDAT